MPAPRPGRALDAWLHERRPGLLRTLAWAVVNYVLLLVATAVGYLVAALPPLSWLPSDNPLSLQDLVLVVVVYGSIGWPLHLGLVAAVSRTRRARLWAVLGTPLLSAIAFGLPWLLAAYELTGRAAVVAYLAYGLLCRMHPRRQDDPSPELTPAA